MPQAPRRVKFAAGPAPYREDVQGNTRIVLKIFKLASDIWEGAVVNLRRPVGLIWIQLRL